MPTVDYRQLYNELFDDVRGLRDDFRSLWVGASDREAPAYEDAYEMTNYVLTAAQKRETPVSNIEKAEQIILGRTATDAAKELHAAGLLTPDWPLRGELPIPKVGLTFGTITPYQYCIYINGSPDRRFTTPEEAINAFARAVREHEND